MKKFLVLAALALIAAPIAAQANDHAKETTTTSTTTTTTEVAAPAKVVVKGDEAFTVDAAGKEVKAVDGTYTTEAGETVIVKDGKIAK